MSYDLKVDDVNVWVLWYHDVTYLCLLVDGYLIFESIYGYDIEIGRYLEFMIITIDWYYNFYEYCIIISGGSL